MIVITGPSGNVGVELTRLMLARAPAGTLRIAPYDMEEIRALCGPDGPYVPLDYDKPATWDAVLAGVSTLYLLFPLPTRAGARRRMLPFMEAAKAAGAKHIVFISVGGAKTGKGVPHHPAEEHLRQLGVDYTIVRPCFYMQNLCRNITTHDYDIAMRDEIFVAAGDGCTTWVDARDVAAAVAEILLNPTAHRNCDYSFTGTEQKTFAQVAAEFSAVLDRPIRYSRPSLPRFSARMLGRGIPWDVVAFMCFFYSTIRFGKPEPVTGDMARILGRTPLTLQQFVADYRPYWERAAHAQLPTVPDWAGGPKKSATDYTQLRQMREQLDAARAQSGSS
jgi:uncharacterized protein YbjT (DUF2867 family)